MIKFCLLVLKFQLRLDFVNFAISGPSTSTETSTKLVKNSGVVGADATVEVTDFTRCLTDTFSVTNPDGPNPPAICGINTGEHSELYCTKSFCQVSSSWQMKLGTNWCFTKISKSMGSIQFAGGQRPALMEESHEKCPSCKSKVLFVCSAYKLISPLTGAPSRDNGSSCGL